MTSDDKQSNEAGIKKSPKDQTSNAQSARDARLADNLRANLRRRKAATRKTKTNKNEAET